MTIKDIAKRALSYFKDQNYIFTPNEYEEIFCKEAKKANVITKDCNKVAEYIKKLDLKYQAVTKNYNIKNVDELIAFLINYLNRENPTKEKEALENLFLYTKRTLDVIAILPIISSQKIAIKHLDFLKPHLTKEEFEALRKEWLDFLSSFDETIINKASKIANIKSKDAIEIIKSLIAKLGEHPNLEELSDAIIFSLTPSYAPFMSDEIAELKKQIRQNNGFILSKAFAEDLKILTKKRIELDKKELQKKLKDLDQITERLSIKILRILKHTNTSSEEIHNIKTELETFHKDGKDFDTIKKRLLQIAKSLDNQVKDFSDEIKKEDEEVKKLKTKVKLLESQIEKLSKEVKTDFLTNISNKKAIMEELNKQESSHKRYNTIYSIVFFDIDHFKNINDTYGHDAGDVILKSLGLLFRRYARDVDMIGRFGGEEFVAILPNTDKIGAYKFAEKLRSIIEKTKFMYKKTRIKVTVSGGVASREETSSMDETLKLADNRLYTAKKSGRNRVCADECK
jgi:diguanylate cyclase (GGDEF)-like protein